MKCITERQLPRSLYSTLPRKFCFTLTEEAPEFLLQTSDSRRRARKLKNVCWQRLELN